MDWHPSMRRNDYMKRGICKLCLEEKDLIESHFVARSIIKTLREESGGNPEPVITDAKIALQTSRQMKDELLCQSCDNCFGKNGEDWVLANMYTVEGFAIRDSLKELAPMSENDEHATYSVANLPAVDIEKMGYFSLSLFWRAAVHSWRTTGSVSDRLEFGPYEEGMRKYLLGLDSFPENMVLFVVVWRVDTPPRFVITLIEDGDAPGVNRDFRSYTAYVPGITLRLLVGKRIPAGLRDDCSYHKRVIHMNVHTDERVINIVRLMNRMSRPSEKLKRFLEELPGRG
jgi:hypothetical protein